MKKQFVPFEIALKLKELGFNEECFAYYYKHGNSKKEKFLYHIMDDEYDIEDIPYVLNSKTITNAPLWQQAFDWFREKHNLDYGVSTYTKEFIKTGLVRQFEPHIINLTTDNALWLESFDDREESRLKTLEELIQITQQKL